MFLCVSGLHSPEEEKGAVYRIPCETIRRLKICTSKYFAAFISIPISRMETSLDTPRVEHLSPSIFFPQVKASLQEEYINGSSSYVPVKYL